MVASKKIGLEAHERQLDRLHSFFPRIDTKVSAIFAIAAGQIAVAILNLSANDLNVWWISVPLAAFLGISIYVYFELYRCTYPHLTGGHSSLVYFGEIAKLREVEYITKYSTLTEDELKADVAAQIWRNAEIVCCKYKYLKRATIGSLFAVIPWTWFLLATSLSHWQVPKLSG